MTSSLATTSCRCLLHPLTTCRMFSNISAPRYVVASSTSFTGTSYTQHNRAYAMRKRGLCCRPVSVCPSVTFVYCIQTAEDIVKLLSRSGNPIILVFLTQSTDTRFQRPKGTHSSVVYTGPGGKICNFRLKSPFISETVRSRSYTGLRESR